jgi:hypothetical protein
MATSPALSPRLQLAKALRERFVVEMGQAMVEVGVAAMDRLTVLMDEPASARENQTRRDAWMAFKDARPRWLDATMVAWRECLEPPSQAKKAKAAAKAEIGGLELVGTEAVENKILASRMVIAVVEKVNTQLDDLRVRIRFLEGAEELAGHDIFRPEVLILLMVEQWAASGMAPDSWAMVTDAVQKLMIDRLKAAYTNANEILIKKGVLPTIELKDRVKAPVRRPGSRAGPGAPTGNSPLADGGQSGRGDVGGGYAQQGGYSQQGANAQDARSAHGGQFAPPSGDAGPAARSNTFWGGGGRAASQEGSQEAMTAPGQVPASVPPPFWRQPTGAHSVHHANYGVADETRMATHNTPLARARSRAQGVIGQIRRLFVSHGGGEMGVPDIHGPSPALVAALAPPPAGQVPQYASGGTLYEDYSPAGVARVAGDLREKTDILKKKAETKGEKATIEIVALMFQAILAEDRIPPGIRVWFARLQMPVLRVALEDPDFLGTTTHPARMLIDRMGSCVMGFDSSDVHGKPMELEIKRIVQVVEQYPETGKKVYQIVYEEFQKFLAKFLTEKGGAKKVVSVAQQVEQKETLTIQYTIEMRNMLKDMPVRDEIRDFLFKVWAEVLAVAAVRKGPQHAETLSLKKSATDLVWAASAKPNRADRARVIQDLPNLLLRLRTGMTLLAISPSDQEKHVKTVSDTLADAFLSKTQAIPQAQIDAMAQRLGNLEDFVSEDGMGDLPLDAESIEMMLGIDASAIEVVANGGSKPTAAMLAWAQELQTGSWFTLDHNKQVTQVQFAWRSDRKHLNLFASISGKSFLIQAGRLAAYLQAGLLVPQEEETLTVRATRDAMAKLEANPERLLA